MPPGTAVCSSAVRCSAGSRRPASSGRTAAGSDVDVILWATGFRAALAHLAPLHLRAPGGGIRMDGTRVADEPRLHLVGYGPSASTIGANRAGLVAARQISTLLAASDAGERRAS